MINQHLPAFEAFSRFFDGLDLEGRRELDRVFETYFGRPFYDWWKAYDLDRARWSQAVREARPHGAP
jgi:hypothetical protein